MNSDLVTSSKRIPPMLSSWNDIRMLEGTHEVKIDSSRRVVSPKPFRDILNDGAMLTLLSGTIMDYQI